MRQSSVQGPLPEVLRETTYGRCRTRREKCARPPRPSQAAHCAPRALHIDHTFGGEGESGNTPIMRYLIIGLALILIDSHAGARAAARIIFQPIARITNTANRDLQILGILLNENKMIGLRFETVHGQDPHVTDYSLRDITTGAVLEKHNAIVLRGSADPKAGEVDLTVTYLSNALLGRYRICRADLVRDSEGHWRLLSALDGRRVRHLIIRTWLLGISTIQGICAR